MAGRVLTTGRPRSIRLPLTVDAMLVASAKAASTTPGRYAARALTADLAGREDRDVTVTVAMSGKLYAALVGVGAVRAVEDTTVNGVSEAPLDGVSTDPSVSDDGITLSPVDLPDVDELVPPSEAELAARGGVGTVPGCVHKRFVTVGNFRRCAVCSAVRGVDGAWRVG